MTANGGFEAFETYRPTYTVKNGGRFRESGKPSIARVLSPHWIDGKEVSCYLKGVVERSPGGLAEAVLCSTVEDFARGGPRGARTGNEAMVTNSLGVCRVTTAGTSE